jgi:hypothetical protein
METDKQQSIDRRTCLAATVPAMVVGLAGAAAAEGTASPLFAAIRRGKLKPGAADEFANRVRSGALPVMRQMDGFQGYYLVVGADDNVIAVSLFTNKAVAEGSTSKLLPWIKENLGPLLASPTEAVDGEVVVSAIA